MRNRIVGSTMAAIGIAAVLGFSPLLSAQAPPAPAQARPLPRTADGKPDLSGIWQAVNTAAWDIQDHHAQKGVPGGQGVVEGDEIPYQPWALAKKKENFENRATADPETKCYLPGVPRITYMPYPFQIVQTPTHVAIFYEYVHAVRNVYMNGTSIPPGPSTGGWATRAAAGKATRWSSTWSISTTRRGSTAPATSTATRCTWSSATRASAPDHMQLRGHDRGPEGVHAAVEDEHAALSAQETNMQLLEYECYAFDEATDSR